ncbi:flagellar biosynthesis protein FlhB [Hoeflea prorocentri]|uniref:Flagellar biosynthetic protein FlhB n=1 Tax=Hoeflea prorocentri TaxID=1922333 RepID=A0A9X3ZIV9_9HYPH|nr:flagellar biosynthesis protein FlhB [Hoeflea prorocentri]MCY6382408.1 flagellar biosynthesis protein FlhB [Hoeflea prorocentri]MDA5400208.1 flagellar biosynthesis protein FlhB [Hoeflea prorocentri]
MSEEQDKDSKTEEPTEKKIRDAVEKGNIPFSREVPIFASSMAILVFCVFFMPSGASYLTVSLTDLFANSSRISLSNGEDAVSLFNHVFWEVSHLLLPAFALMMVFGIAASVMQNIPRPAAERVKPQLSRVSIKKGFKRLFGAQGLVDFAKSITKILVISAIVAVAMLSDYFEVLTGMFSDPATVPQTMARLARKVFVIILIATAVLAMADLLWTRYHWRQELRMTRQELKDEIKQTDGDPIVKARQRSLARDRARQRMISDVPRATLVIANPTHYAVALRYKREEDEAPVVVAKGQDLVALKIREIAEGNDIPVFEDPPLARSIFAQASVGSVIPPAFYKAVAELIHVVYAKSATAMNQDSPR